MALNWNQEVSFSSIVNLFKGQKDADTPTTGYPTKTTMNLYEVSTKTTSLRTVVLGGILVLVCLVAFAKFGVFDQFAALQRKEAELAAQQKILMETTSSVGNSAELSDLYEGYTRTYGDPGPTVLEVLDLVEQHVMHASKVSAITYTSTGTLTLTLNDVSLETIGILAEQLKSQDMVAGVNVTNASTKNSAGNNTTVSTMVIAMNIPKEEED